jgi:hypothetical protein
MLLGTKYTRLTNATESDIQDYDMTAVLDASPDRDVSHLKRKRCRRELGIMLERATRIDVDEEIPLSRHENTGERLDCSTPDKSKPIVSKMASATVHSRSKISGI